MQVVRVAQVQTSIGPGLVVQDTGPGHFCLRLLAPSLVSYNHLPFTFFPFPEEERRERREWRRDSRADAALPAPLAGARGLRALSTLPRDPTSAPAPSPRQPSVGSPLGLSKILGYEQASRISGAQVLPRWFSTGASNGSSDQQISKTVAGMVQSDAVKAQEGASAKVTAFSPSEAAIGKYRISPLTEISKRVRQSETRTKVSYLLIPMLLLVSRNSLSASVLVASVYHQIYMFNKEIILDYVHHDITRKWALIYFKMLLLVLAKDTMVNFGLF